MGLIDRMDLLSGCGGLQGAEQQARARDTVSLSAIATFVTAPLVVERAELFPHRLQLRLASHLSYRRIKCGHFKVPPHTRVPGGMCFLPV